MSYVLKSEKAPRVILTTNLSYGTYGTFFEFTLLRLKKPTSLGREILHTASGLAIEDVSHPSLVRGWWKGGGGQTRGGFRKAGCWQAWPLRLPEMRSLSKVF